MTGIPSIVAGLFAFALFSIFFGPGVRMGIMGSVALSVLMIPIVVRSTEEMLRIVPNALREASYALGVPKWRTIIKVVLPTALGRHRDRRRARDRPHHRRDRAAADHHRRRRVGQHQPVRRPHAEPRGLRVQLLQVARRAAASRRSTAPGPPRSC